MNKFIRIHFRKWAIVFFISIVTFTSCKTKNSMIKNNINPPKAEKQHKEFNMHGDKRIDDYYWLNERDNPKVLSYLNAENDYYEKMTAHTKSFQDKLFLEMKSRIKEDDASVPYKKNGFYYITKFKKGEQYPIYYRKENLEDEKDILLFDVNEMAKGFEYFHFTGLNISPNNKFAAYAVDTLSRRLFNIHFKNLETGKIYDDTIPQTEENIIWANDNKTIFYTKKNPVTLRVESVYKHILGDHSSKDELVYFEEDETFSVYVTKTKSQKYLLIVSNSTVSTEYLFLNADKPNDKFTVFQKRERDLEYDIEHYNDHFYILTNKDNATNFKIMITSELATDKKNWKDLISHRDDVLLEDMSLFKEYMVLEERNQGLNKIRIIRWDEKDDYYLPFSDEIYTASAHYIPDFDTDILRYSYNSLTTPSSIIDFNMKNKTSKIMKEQQILGGQFDKRNYISERLWATARDGKKIAISLVRHKDTPLNSNTPLLLYGYGSYGYTIDPNFSSTRLSLLDRGFVFAIAHIRGSEYLGRKWYEDGKLLNKKNTFYDFIDCGMYLIGKKYTSRAHLYAEGRSAGGLLMGAVVNMQPDLFNGIIATVPFVDVITTMLDDTIPLTTSEYDEWGNPNEKVYYDYMKSYSPYDNVERMNYPKMLVTTGLHDSQVQYFEPAKWVAKLRDMKTDKNKIFLYTDMKTGHSGSSGRFDALKDIAREYAFLLDLEGINK